MEMGVRLQFLRDQCGMSQKALEHLAGLPQGSVSKIEKGIRQISATDVLAFSKAMDITPNQFYGIDALPPTTLHCRKRQKAQRRLKRMQIAFSKLIETLDYP